MTATLGWPTELVLLRHGESTGNLADARAHAEGAEVVDLETRDADIPLSRRGQRQAAAVGRWLATGGGAPRPPQVVLCSPYRRARSTAEAVVTALEEAGTRLPSLRSDERLRERDLGWWDGLTGAGVRARYPEEFRRRARLGKFYYRPPGGESWCDVALRMRSLLSSLREEHAGRRVLLVTHQAVIMNMRLVLEGLEEADVLHLDGTEPLANCSVTAYAGSDDGGLGLTVAGDTSAVADLAGTDDDPVEEEPAVAVRS